jgi:hypothetical protein
MIAISPKVQSASKCTWPTRIYIIAYESFKSTWLIAKISHSIYFPKNEQADYTENRAQKALLTMIENALKVIGTAQDNLQKKPSMADIGNDPASLQWKENLLDVNKQNVSSHLAALNAATAQVLILTSDGPFDSDCNAIGAAISSMYAVKFITVYQLSSLLT